MPRQQPGYFRSLRNQSTVYLAGIAICALAGMAVLREAAVGPWRTAGYQVAGDSNDVVGSVHRRISLRHRSKPAKKRVRIWKDAEHQMAGIASFYSYDTQTASGEKFDPREMTCAHRTLPFGTRLRVTDTETGQSVTVRVNDRGPYVEGRIIDLTTAGAEALGITGRGLAKVKLDVIEDRPAAAASHASLRDAERPDPADLPSVIE
jgi:rare lipoprotein A